LSQRYVLEVSFRVLRCSVPGSDGPFHEVGAGAGAVAFAHRGASDRRGSLAFPMRGFLRAGSDAEQLPPLARTEHPSPPLRRYTGSLATLVRRWPKPLPSWGSSPGVPQRPPLHRHPRVRPLSVARGSGLPHPNAFRPCRSSRLRRLAPHTAPRVCCTPQPVMGFTWFRAEGRLSPTPDAPPRRPFPLEALRRISGGPVARTPASSPLVHGATALLRRHRFPRPRGLVPIRSSTRATSPPPEHELPGFPRPRLSPGSAPSPERSRWFPSCPNTTPWHRVSRAAAAALGASILPVAPLAGCDRGARDGYRVSHGHLAVARNSRPLLPAAAPSCPPLARRAAPGLPRTECRPRGTTRADRSCPGAITDRP